MISIKNEVMHTPKKKLKSYSIVDKTELNKLCYTLSEKIKKDHINNYDIIDEAINCLQSVEYSIRDDLYEYYSEVYTDILIDLKIESNDEDSIKEHADFIYKTVNEKIRSQLFYGKITDIPGNKLITYISAITAYVFYKCKFLIPIEK